MDELKLNADELNDLNDLNDLNMLANDKNATACVQYLATHVDCWQPTNNVASMLSIRYRDSHSSSV